MLLAADPAIRPRWLLSLLAATLLVFTACGSYDRFSSGGKAGEPQAAGGATGSEGSAATWLRLPDAPTARTEVGAAHHNGIIFVAGGIAVGDGSGRVLRTFEAFDVAASTWSKLPELPEPRHHAAVAAVDGVVYVVGGYSDMAFTPSAKVYAYEVETRKWREAPPLPEAVGAGGAAVLDGKVYFVGGAGKDRKPSSRLYVLGDSAWRRLADMPTPREHLGVAATSSFLYALGGRFPITSVAERYDPEEDKWESLPPKPTARGGVAGAGVGGRFACVAGGEDEQRTYADAECFDETTGGWVVLPPMAVARHGLAAAGTDRQFFTIAGGDRPGLAETAVVESISPGPEPEVG